jgi:hypothetical protein
MFKALGFAALLAVAAGCASTKQAESMLTAAGFKEVPATTPAQQAHLKTLPNHKISQVQRDGKTYYIYPDAGHNLLYVGQAAQYQEYQKIRKEREQAEEETNVQMWKQDTQWETWGPWPSNYMP